MIKNQLVLQTRRGIWLALLFATGYLMLASGANAQNIRGVLLGNAQLGPGQFEEADFNSDGVIDSADLLLQLQSSGPTAVSFSQASSTATEGDSQDVVEVFFNRPYTGTIEWSVTGSASVGQDFVGGSNSMQVDGISANITIDLLDDSTREQEAKTIELLLLDNGDFELGDFQVHTIYLYDNDRIWDGSVNNGFADYQFTLELIRNGGTTTGKLMSDGDESFPQGDFTLSDLLLTSSEFRAITQNIDVNSQELVIRQPMQRRLEFESNSSVSNSYVSEDFVRGGFTELITATDPANSYLNRTIEGMFSMVRRPQVVPQVDPMLSRYAFTNEEVKP